MSRRYDLWTEGNRAYDIQSDVNDAISASGVVNGIAVVSAPHTTAAVGVISYHDPLGLEDVMDEIARVVPTRIDFKHEHDTPQDAAGHVKSTIVGPTIAIIVEDGEALIGHSQHIFFLEFDGPRKRQYYVQVVGE